MLQMCTSGLSKGWATAKVSLRQAMETCPHLGGPKDTAYPSLLSQGGESEPLQAP